MSFSPVASHKKSINLSPTNNIENNILNTELAPKFSFSSIQPNKLNINENLSKKNNNFEIINKELEIISDEMTKELNHIKPKNYYKNEKINMNNQKDYNNIKNSEEKKIENYEEIINNNEDKIIDLNKRNSLTELKEIKEKTSKIENKNTEIVINKNQKIFKTKSTPKVNQANPYLKHKNILSKNSLNNKKGNKNITNTIETKAKDENKKTCKITKLVKKCEILNILNTDLNKEEKKIEKKSFMEDYILPNDIKKECIIELNKLDKNKKEKIIDDNLKFGIPATTRENKNRIYKNLKNNSQNKKKILKMKKMENFKENINNNSGNNMYSNDLLNQGKIKSNNNLKENYVGENNLRFSPYYKEIYG